MSLEKSRTTAMFFGVAFEKFGIMRVSAVRRMSPPNVSLELRRTLIQSDESGRPETCNRRCRMKSFEFIRGSEAT